MTRDSIYVEIRIASALDEVWRLTQTPELHERWDLRFTEIRYLPRPDPAQPQQFHYATRIGFGLRIQGAGESMGENHGPAGRTSALKFWSDDPKSLIREGSGYWKYVPVESGIRFLTRYDYRTRFGFAGAAVDRFIFRPLLGWATAWSFDRLRLWIEKGIDPAVSMQRALIHAVARISIALVWFYQGLVPKLLFAEASGEIETVRGLTLFANREIEAIRMVGAGEIVIALLFMILWRVRALFLVNILIMIALMLTAMIGDARLFIEQFNPATLNLSVIALSVIGWIAARDFPSARNCLRREPQKPSP